MNTVIYSVNSNKGIEGNLHFGNFIIVIIILFGMVLVVYSYLYLTVIKSKEIQLFKMVGNSTKKVIIYLITQNLFLVLISYLIGLIVFTLVNPISNYIALTYIDVHSNYFSIYSESVIISLYIIIFIFVITSLVSMGYVSRKQIFEINDNNLDELRNNKPLHMPLFIYIFFYLFGIIMFVFSDDVTYGAVVFSGIGCIGAIGIVKSGLYKIIRKSNRDKNYLSKITNISNSNLAFTLKNSYIIVGGMLFSSTVMLERSIENLSDIGSKQEFIISLLAYFISVFIFILSVFFKYLIDFSIKIKELDLLYKIGYSLNKIKNIVYDEVVKFYAIIFFFIDHQTHLIDEIDV